MVALIIFYSLLVGLVNLGRVPEPLDNAVAGGGALAAQVLGDGDVEVGLVRGDAGGRRCVDVPGDQGVADDGVARGVDDGDVRVTAGITSWLGSASEEEYTYVCGARISTTIGTV